MKIRPLEFVDDKKERNFQNKNNENDFQITSPKFQMEKNQNQDIKLKNLFDDANATICNHEVTIMSPSRHKIYVEDTPVLYYGLSIAERRKRGLKY